MTDDGTETSEHGPGAVDAHQPEPADLLNAAYAERTRQLYDARGALAEVVATLRSDLQQRRDEAAALREGLDAAELRNQTLEADNRALYAELGRLNQLVSDLRNTKVMRWSAGARRAVYSLRARRK